MLDTKVETFLTVCQEMNFTAASKKLHISQPAVTQQIKALEDYYGVPLFEFEGKRFRLTKYGTLIYNTFMAMSNNEHYLENELHALKNGEQSLSMGVTKTIGEFFISKPLSNYLANHPNADVSTDIGNTSHLISKLNNGEIDFAIIEGNFSKTDFEYETIAVLDFVPVCNANHKFSHSISVLDDLFGETLITREPGSGTRDILEKTLLEANRSLTDFAHQCVIGNMHVILDLLLADCGISFLYKDAIANHLTQGTLKEIPLKDVSISHEINMIIRKDNLQKDSIIKLTHELFADGIG